MATIAMMRILFSFVANDTLALWIETRQKQSEAMAGQLEDISRLRLYFSVVPFRVCGLLPKQREASNGLGRSDCYKS